MKIVVVVTHLLRLVLGIIVLVASRASPVFPAAVKVTAIKLNPVLQVPQMKTLFKSLTYKVQSVVEE